MKKGECTRERIYQYIIKFITDNGYSPTVREISIGADLKSTSSIKHHLDKMVEDGLIQMKDYAPRSICVVGYKFVKE